MGLGTQVGKTYYTLVTVGQLLTHLQSTCGRVHFLDVLTLKNEIQRYHTEIKEIPKYIIVLEDAEAKAE